MYGNCRTVGFWVRQFLFFMEGMGDENAYKRNESAAAGVPKGTSVRTRTTLSIFRTVSGNKLIILEF